MAELLLFAEELEKRAKRGALAGRGGEENRPSFGAVAKVCSSWVESTAAAASGVEVHVTMLVKSDMAPKTEVGLAAFEGFFSA